MSEPFPPKPPQRPEPLAYRTPQPPEPDRKAFSSIRGNIAMGSAAIVCSLLLASRLRGVLPLMAIPLTTLALGMAAAFVPRYRGLLFGMLLIALGLPLLLLGLCMGMRF